MNGLNGDIVYKADDVYAGMVDGEHYGYKRPLRVTVSVRVERLTRKAEYQTTDHRTVTGPLDFAITTSVWRPDGRDIISGGATVEPLLRIRQDVPRGRGKYAPGFTRDQLDVLIYLSRWHLNAMTAECDHQDVKYDSQPRRPSLEETKPCLFTGYKYGSAWLVRELPVNFVDVLRAAMPPAGGVFTEPEGDFPPSLRQRMTADGITGRVRHTGTKEDGTRLWRARFTRPGGAVFSSPYFTGPAVTGAPAPDEVMASVITETAGYQEAGSFEAWARDYGYDPEDGPEARRIYNTLEIQAGRLEEFLGDSFRAYLDETER